MRDNVQKISTKSVTSDELRAQRAMLNTAERKLKRMEQGLELIREKITGLRQQLADARSLHRDRATTKTKRVLATMTRKLDDAVQQRNRMSSDYREFKLVVRDQRALCKSMEKKEEARQKAVARFLKEWERRYDREIRMKEKNVRQRKRLDRT